MNIKYTKMMLISLIVGGFIMPAVIINSLQFLGFAVIWSFWSHLFVYFDLLIFAAIVQSSGRLIMQELISSYMKVTRESLSKFNVK